MNDAIFSRPRETVALPISVVTEKQGEGGIKQIHRKKNHNERWSKEKGVLPRQGKMNREKGRDGG